MEESEEELMADSSLDDLKKDENRDWMCRLVVDDQGRSALDAAVEGASIEEITRLVELEHEQLTSYDWMYTRSLAEAAKRGQFAAVQRLLTAGARIHDVGNRTFTAGAAIEEAAGKGHLNIVKVLLDAEKTKAAKDAYSPEAQQRAAESGQFEESGRLKEAKKFLERAAESKNSALQYAAGIGSMEIAKLLVENGADANAEPERHSSQTALTMAAKGGHEDIARFLLQHGAKPTRERASNDQHFPLRAAAEGGHLGIVKMLLEAGCDPTSEQALHAAGHSGHLPVVECLLQAGADCNADRVLFRDGQMTALQKTALGGHLGCLDALIEAGADVYVPAGRRGYTALQAAAKSGNPAVVQRLISNGADVNAPPGGWGRTALQAAAENGSLEIVLMLLDAGAEVEAELAHSGSTSLELAINGGHAGVAEMLLQGINLIVWQQHDRWGPGPLDAALVAAIRQGYEPILQQMLPLGMPVGGAGRYSRWVTIAAELGRTSIIKLLIPYGADVNGSEERWGLGPLQSAVKANHIETARFLIEAGANLNMASGRSGPPLHMAAQGKHVEIFKLLLEAGADIYKVSYTEKTVRQCAEKGGSKEILQLLKEKEAQVLPPPPDPEDEPLDVSKVTKTSFCSLCKTISADKFLGRQSFDFHPSLTSLRSAARSGCPFCMFFWKRIGIHTITIPQPSVCKIYHQSGYHQSGHSVWSQIEEPYPRDIERPKGLRADFTVDIEPFERKRKPLPGDTSSASTCSQIQTWLDKCCHSHSRCKNDGGKTFRPTRLLDLSHWKNARTLKLVDSTVSSGDSPYVTLSHRRLPESAATTLGNVASRYNLIAADTLPLVYLHAIEVTQTLNINYLWIDALCIIQDSQDDWSHESPLLGKIYQNAILTIAAAASENVSQGLFRTFDTSNDSVEIPCISNPATGKTKLVRAMKHQSSWDTDYKGSPLSNRAWALQEREFSTRILYYTATQVLWECREIKATEGFPTDNKLSADNIRLLDDTLATETPEELYKLWYRTIKDYSSRELSNEQDKLPALSSIAALVAHHTKTKYIAGLWEADLLHGLAWASFTPYHHPRPGHTRPNPSTAPTWSWASVQGPTTYLPPASSYANPPIPRSAQLVRKPGMAVITSHTLTLSPSPSPSTSNPTSNPHLNPNPTASPSPFGSIATATLHLHTPLLPAVLGYDASSNWLGRIIQLRDLTGEVIFGDMHFDVPAERGENEIKVVRVVYLYTETGGSKRSGASAGGDGDGDDERGIGLALVPVQGREGVYRRVGIVQGLGLRWVRGGVVEDVVVV